MWTRASCEPVQSIAVSVVPAPSGEEPVPATPCTACSACFDGVFEDVEEIACRDAVGFEVLERVDGGGARGSARGAAAVGDGEQPGSGVGGVLVALADQALVGQCGVTDSQGLGGRRTWQGPSRTGGRRGRRPGPAGRRCRPRPGPRTRGSPGPPRLRPVRRPAGCGPAACPAGEARPPAGPAPVVPGRRGGSRSPGRRGPGSAVRARRRAAVPSATAGTPSRTPRWSATPCPFSSSYRAHRPAPPMLRPPPR